MLLQDEHLPRTQGMTPDSQVASEQRPRWARSSELQGSAGQISGVHCVGDGRGEGGRLQAIPKGRRLSPRVTRRPHPSPSPEVKEVKATAGPRTGPEQPPSLPVPTVFARRQGLRLLPPRCPPSRRVPGRVGAAHLLGPSLTVQGQAPRGGPGVPLSWPGKLTTVLI